MRRVMRLAVWLLVLMAAACAKHEPVRDADRQFAHAMELLEAHDFARATLAFERFLAKYPLDPRANRAEVLRIYAAFRDREYILAETLAERFLDRVPGYKDAPYVWYMLGRAREAQLRGATHDVEPARKAAQAYRTLIERYPDTPYAEGAKKRLQRVRNLLAEHELAIARFYFKRGAYVAAINRCARVIERYQTTPAVEEALYLQAVAQWRLGLDKAARETAALLRYNAPQSPWLARLPEGL
ncbi:MAG: outer membrane protein assembly factor BamD [Zetaproteobacteria bacterium]|nr:MAG: outer membrane protein assembly factor BamD [Zetaproteobacteria bacterium]